MSSGSWLSTLPAGPSKVLELPGCPHPLNDPWLWADTASHHSSSLSEGSGAISEPVSVPGRRSLQIIHSPHPRKQSQHELSSARSPVPGSAVSCLPLRLLTHSQGSWLRLNPLPAQSYPLSQKPWAGSDGWKAWTTMMNQSIYFWGFLQAASSSALK